MKCWLCGGLLPRPAYRKIYFPYNVPAHSDSELGECISNMVTNRFEVFLRNAKRLQDLGIVAPFSYSLLTAHSQEEAISFLLFLTEDDWRNELAEKMPERVVSLPEYYMEYPITLKKTEWERLVKQEALMMYQLGDEGGDVYRLKHVTTDLYQKLQKGEMPLTHPHYTNFISWSIDDKLQERTVLIPKELENFEHVAVQEDKWLERLLKVYSEKSEYIPSTRVINFANTLHDIKGNRRELLRKALFQYPKNKDLVLNNVPTSSIPKSSIRLDIAEYYRLKQVSKDLGKSIYYLIPALIRAAADD